MPLYLLIEAHVLAAERLHGDDTTVPVLAKTKTDTGRIWTYVRDDRPFGGPAPPAAIFHYSRDRRGEHPLGPPLGLRGILQAHAFSAQDRTSVVWGKGVLVRVDLGGGRINQKKKTQ